LTWGIGPHRRGPNRALAFARDPLDIIAAMGVPTTSASIGRMIRLSRKRASLPIGRVAKDCKISASQLERIEAGDVRPTVVVLDRIARALGIRLIDLVLDPQDAENPLLGLSGIARAVLDLPDDVGPKLDAVEAATVLAAMTACCENQSAAARLLGMERKAFTRRLSWARRSKLDPAASARRAE
jgi:transcriptional regulator with XRE-family HTH domain